MPARRYMKGKCEGTDCNLNRIDVLINIDDPLDPEGWIALCSRCAKGEKKAGWTVISLVELSRVGVGALMKLFQLEEKYQWNAEDQ